MYAAQLAAVPSYRPDLGEAWEIAKIYWGAMSESRMRAGPARGFATPGTPRRSRGWTPTGDAAQVRGAGRGPRGGRGRHRLRRPQDGSAARPTPPRSPSTAPSSRCPTTCGGPRCGAWSSSGRVKGAPGPGERGRSGDRPVRRTLSGPRAAPARAPHWPSSGCSPARPPPSPSWPCMDAPGGFCSASRPPWPPRLVLPRGWWSRLAFVLGWAAVVGYAAVTRPEGDYLIAANVAGYTLLAAAFGLIVVGVATLPRPHGAARSPGSPEGRHLGCARDDQSCRRRPRRRVGASSS